ncbi:MAG: hypothetical protein ABSH10_06115 [Phycisphaerae bacterium]|jgi:hypothetical protein
MDSLRQLFFEDPLYVYITLAFAELVLLVIWHETRSQRWLIALAGPPILAGIVLLVATLVVTDREQLIGAAHAIACDAETGDIAATEAYLDDSYSGLGVNKPGVVAIARSFLKKYRVTHVGFTRLTVEVYPGGRATMHAATIISFGSEGSTAIVWDVQWVKRPAGWRILEVAEPQQKLEL